MNTIAKPFGILLLWLNNLVGNYGLAIFLFALIVKLIMLPFQMKSKKGMMRMAALNPQVQELQKQHGANQRKYQEEVSKLYKEEHVNPMGGCLWSLIPFPILIALYSAIRQPLTVMMRVPKELLAEGGAILNKLTELGFSFTGNAGYLELAQSQFISEHFSDFAGLSDKLANINYNFLGINLGDKPMPFFWNHDKGWIMGLLLVLIPVISALTSWLSMKISQKTNPAPAPAAGDQTQAQMKGMNLMMPLMSLYFGFIMPAALGIYWIYGNVFGIIQEIILNKHYGKIIAKETAVREEKMRLRQAEWERKRQETEKLKAAGLSTENSNTSKKKKQARQKAELDELKAAAIREEKAARRAAMGITEEEKPASQVGNRRYARGRAYVPDRFTNPEGAEEATAAAAAESEFGESIDETVVESVGTAETAAAVSELGESMDGTVDEPADTAETAVDAVSEETPEDYSDAEAEESESEDEDDGAEENGDGWYSDDEN